MVYTVYANGGGALQAVRPDSTKTQTVSVSGTAAATSTAAPVEGMYLVTLPCDCHIEIAETPVATTNDHKYLVGMYHIPLLKGDKISFIKASGETDGTAYVTRAT